MDKDSTDITTAACAQLGYSDSGGKLAVVIMVDEWIEVDPLEIFGKIHHWSVKMLISIKSCHSDWLQWTRTNGVHSDTQWHLCYHADAVLWVYESAAQVDHDFIRANIYLHVNNSWLLYWWSHKTGGWTHWPRGTSGSVCAQWKTVCTGSQELAGAVCSQMGYSKVTYRINDIALSYTYL